MQKFEDLKQSLIQSGYSEEMAQRIAEGLKEVLQPINQKEGKK